MVARSENLDRTVKDLTTANSDQNLDGTVDDTTANSDQNLDGTVDDTAANCLMLLSRVGEDEKRRVFRCKTCMKAFSSFQALGGHRASHNKPINNRSDDKSSSSSSSLLSSGSVTMKTKNKKTKSHVGTTTSHTCPICGLEFSMGQALGGHMRKHRNERDSGGALVTRSFLPEEATTVKKSSSGKIVECSDLGLDSMESTINLKLELGRTIS